ncbi:MAG: M28 family peptidase [Nonlabens sp.]
MRNTLLFILVCLALSCKKESATESVQVMSGDMKTDVQILAADSLQGRETGTPYELAAADYIAKRMKQSGLQPAGNENTYFQTFSFKPSSDPHQEAAFVDEKGDGFLTGTNVIGMIDNNADHTVIIGAHYDHLGMGGEGSLHRGDAAVHNGADDNASGVAVMLELGYRFRESENETNFTARFGSEEKENGVFLNKGGNFKNSNYLFIAFSGEEMGLLGSNYFTKNPTVDMDKANYMINMDMVGRLNDESVLAISGTGTTPRWKQVLKSANEDFELALSESGVGPSDHTSFYLNDIPVLHFFTGQHTDYHKPGDDANKLNYNGMQQIADYIERVVVELNGAGKLPFRKTKNESEEVPRFKVALGVIPDYLFTGKGMRIDGVSEDKPAQKAGLQKGDIVIKLGDSTVVDMMSYMRVLSTYEAGDKAQVIVDRNGKKIEETITFQED